MAIRSLIVVRGDDAEAAIELAVHVGGLLSEGSTFAGHVRFQTYRRHRLVVGEMPDARGHFWQALKVLEVSPSYDGWSILVASKAPVLPPPDVRKSLDYALVSLPPERGPESLRLAASAILDSLTLPAVRSGAERLDDA